MSRLIRDTLDQHHEVYFMYSRNNENPRGRTGIMNFMRNLLQGRHQRQQQRRSDVESPHVRTQSSQNDVEVQVDREGDSDVPPVPAVEELQEDVTL